MLLLLLLVSTPGDALVCVVFRSLNHHAFLFPRTKYNENTHSHIPVSLRLSRWELCSFFHNHCSSSLSSRLNRGNLTLNQHVSMSWLPGQVGEEVLVDHVGLLAVVRAVASSLSTFSRNADVSACGSRENAGILSHINHVHSTHLPPSNVTQSLTAAVPILQSPPPPFDAFVCTLQERL